MYFLAEIIHQQIQQIAVIIVYIIKGFINFVSDIDVRGSEVQDYSQKTFMVLAAVRVAAESIPQE